MESCTPSASKCSPRITLGPNGRFRRFAAPTFFDARIAGEVAPAIASAAELIRGGAA